jgi:hypothetical protein
MCVRTVVLDISIMDVNEHPNTNNNAFVCGHMFAESGFVVFVSSVDCL